MDRVSLSPHPMMQKKKKKNFTVCPIIARDNERSAFLSSTPPMQQHHPSIFQCAIIICIYRISSLSFFLFLFLSCRSFPFFRFSFVCGSHQMMIDDSLIRCMWAGRGKRYRQARGIIQQIDEHRAKETPSREVRLRPRVLSGQRLPPPPVKRYQMGSKTRTGV
jgi:hypothetical protein